VSAGENTLRPWTTAREAEDPIILRYMLWGFDETPYRVLTNKMVTTRSPSTCAICFQGIPKGSRVRAQTEVYDGQVKTFRLCPACCSAVVLDHIDGDCLRMEAQTQLGISTANEAPIAKDSAVSDGRIADEG